MPDHSVLLLEDDPNLGLILQEHLQLNGYRVVHCVNGQDGLATCLRERFDLCLVDVMMPRMDGFTFARELRSTDRETPIIFLTAKSMKEDRIEGFRAGADDYVTKPFSMEELMLRMRAVLRRTGSGAAGAEEPSVFSIGSYDFDYTRRTLSRAGNSVRLTGREAGLLRLLCLHRNRTLDRSVALKTLWGDDDHYSGRSMDVFVSKLRKYLKHDRAVELLSEHGRGLRLVAPETGAVEGASRPG
jgi:DNA-binding response OmpR family regulator